MRWVVTPGNPTHHPVVAARTSLYLCGYNGAPPADRARYLHDRVTQRGRGARPDETIRTLRSRPRDRFRCRGTVVLRLPRPERRGEDHHDAHDLVHVPAER